LSEDASVDDLLLVQDALAGQQQAFGVLVERYQDRLFNTLLRVLGSREDANDVMQDAFVQAYTKLDSFRGAARFYTWLYRIAMNLALSHLRRRRPTASVEVAKAQAGEEPTDPQPGPDVGMIATEQVEAVQSALLNLGDQHRQILLLREMEGCSYETISEILQMPVGTVRSRLFRARLQLKAELEIMLPDDTDRS